MADYQLSHLTLSTRMRLVSQMLNPNRPWGQVTELSREYSVSRKFLYELQHKARASMQAGLLPRPSGRKAARKQVEIDDDFVRRAIAIGLSVVPGTVRTVQLLLELLCGVHRSTGYISQTAQQLGEAARQYMAGLHLPLQALGEADEIFQGRQPCLTLVDGRSFLVLSLSKQERRDATTWGCVLLDVEQQGVQLVDVACDGARGIRAGVEEAGLAVPLRPDLFHLLREAHRVSQRLEKGAYRAIKTAERARRAQQEAEQPRRRRGAPLKVQVDLPEAETQERQAIAHCDAWDWLWAEIRRAIEPINHQGHIASATLARQTVEIALELLQSLDHPIIQPFIDQMLPKLDELIAPLVWLEQALAPWKEGLPTRTEAFLTWAWQHQQALHLTPDQVLPDQQALVSAFWNALSLFHRSSSLAESLHSWLRPYLQVHRGIPDWLLPLLQLLWNHHPFQRGKRRDKSPMAWAGLENVPTLAQLFDQLVQPERAIPLSTEFFKVPEKCYPIYADL
jgi:hypothetical protein